MNSAFIGYEELSRSRRVLATSADNTLIDPLYFSYPTQLPRSLIAKYSPCTLYYISEDKYILGFR